MPASRAVPRVVAAVLPPVLAFGGLGRPALGKEGRAPGGLAKGALAKDHHAKDHHAKDLRAKDHDANDALASASTFPSVLALAAPSVAPAPNVAPAVDPTAPISGRIVALRPSTVRALVTAALRHAGLDHDDALIDLAARARASALAPEVRLRAFRGLDVGARTDTTDALDRTTATDRAQTALEARLSWRLDRLVFADEEVAIERLREGRREQRTKLTARVVELAIRWQRAERAASDPRLLDGERDDAALDALEAALALDALTGGAAGPLLLHPTP